MQPVTKVGSYRDLLVWQKGIDLVKCIYQITGERCFPPEEKFGLISQMRRAAVSVPSNIAEGQARGGTKEFIQFLYVSKGSLAELDTQLVISSELRFLAVDPLKELCEKIAELQRMLHTLIQRLENNVAKA